MPPNSAPASAPAIAPATIQPAISRIRQAAFFHCTGARPGRGDYIRHDHTFHGSLDVAERLLDRFDISDDAVRAIVHESIKGADDGELFLEYREGEALVFDNGRLKTANFNVDQGFGLRAVAGEATGYAHSSELSEAALRRAADAVSAVKAGYSGTLAERPAGTNRHLYGEDNPIAAPGFEEKARLLQEIDAYLRAADPRVRQVTASLAASWQRVEIVRADGSMAQDIRPLVRVNVSVVVGEGDRQETGSYGLGGRKSFGEFL